MTAAIYYATEAYSTGGPKLMGRHAAGEGFLRAYVRHAKAERLDVFAANRKEAEGFAAFCRENGAGERPVRWIPFGQQQGLREAGALFYPGPGLAELAWARRRLGQTAYSLSGVTHTISSHTAMDSIAAAVTAPVEAWDALVCTSRAVADAAARLFSAQAEYLKTRLEAKRLPTLNIALIPLGADCARLAPSLDQRAAWRGKLGIAEGDVAFLFMGRLSYHAKANPFPMYVALEAAARRSGQRIHLIQAGWFANESIERQFREGARALCPAVQAHFLDGRDAAVREGIWHAADAFTSLSDNIQETFGLTPVEAMAAGLPGVISDWDGYKDTVRHSTDGFRVPTLAPPPGLGADLALRHAENVDNYDRYIGHASLFVSVDVTAAAEAYTALAQDAALRARMGAAARERALQTFDWPVIVRQYEALWAELAKRRAQAGASRPVALAHPARSDPYWLFASYPTHTLGPADRLHPLGEQLVERFTALTRIHMLAYGGELMPTAAQCTALLEAVTAAPGMTVLEALKTFEPAAQPVVMRGIVWLAKLGLLRVEAVKVAAPVKPAPAPAKAVKPQPRKGKRGKRK